MEHSNVDMMVAKLRAAGVDLWVEDGRIRGRMRAGGKPPYAVGVMMAELRDLGMVAVDFLKREALGEQPAAGPAEPDADRAEGNQRVINKPLDRPDGFDQIRAAGGVVLPDPDVDGIVRLVQVSPEVAFSAGELINDGKAELIGNVIYRRLSNVFDVTYRVVEP